MASGEEEGETEPTISVERVSFPDTVEAALAKCLPSDDPLDAKEFDPIDYVNENFPNEKSYARLEPFLAKLRGQIGELDVNIFDAVKAQSTQGTRATEEIVQAKESIKMLQSKVKDIKGKAEQSEVMVQKICRDIKKLDYAKRHLTYTITSLKRFHMLVTAVDQLDFMVENRQYQETANLLQAVAQLFVHFEEHYNIPSIMKLRDSVGKTRTLLEEQIFIDFEALSEVSADHALLSEEQQNNSNKRQGASTDQASLDSHPHTPTSNAGGGGGGTSLFANSETFSPGGQSYHSYDDPAPATSMFYSSDAHTPESLAGACAVVDALGSKIRRKLIEKVCSIWLTPYDKLFGPGQKYCELETTDRRYAWLRRLLRDNEERYESIFPAHWEINKHLLGMFVKKTESHLKAELSKIDPPESADVTALVRALRRTLDFEHEMSVRFESKRNTSGKASQAEGAGGEKDEVFDDEGNVLDPMSSDAIRARYLEKKKKREAKGRNAGQDGTSNKNTDDGDDDGEMDQQIITMEEAIDDAINLPSVKGVVSAVFQPYLISYVHLEAKNMRDKMNELTKEEANQENDPESKLTLYLSASQVFGEIEASLKRCVQFTKGQGFYDLYVQLRKILLEYSELLNAKLPKQGTTLSIPLVKRICFVCNSAEYCTDVIEKIAERIQSKIDEAYVDSIDMEDVVNQFFVTMKNATSSLISGVHAMVDPELVAMTRTNWANVQEVGDHSKYVTSLSFALREFVPVMHELLSSILFRQFCDKFFYSFVSRFRDTVFRCKKVGEMGSQQLHLDAQAIRDVLLKVPTMGHSGDDDDGDGESQPGSMFAMYTKNVNEEMKGIITALKLVSMNLTIDLLIENFKTFLENGTTEDLKIVLELKGFKPADQKKAMKLAKESNIPEAPSSIGLGSSGIQFSVPTSQSATASTSAGAASGTFTNVFSKMSDMREHLDKVASTTSAGAKGFSSLSATFQNSYNRAVNKKAER